MLSVYEPEGGVVVVTVGARLDPPFDILHSGLRLRVVRECVGRQELDECSTVDTCRIEPRARVMVMQSPYRCGDTRSR